MAYLQYSRHRLRSGPRFGGAASINVGGFGRTFDDIRIAGVDLAYELGNPQIRNGAYIEGRVPGTRSAGLHWRLFGNGSRTFGTDLYLDRYGEVGAGLGGLRMGRGHLELDVSYLFGKYYDGWSLGMLYRF